MAPSWLCSHLSQQSPPQISRTVDPQWHWLQMLSRCQLGTKALSLRAWLAVLEGGPGWWPLWSPYLEQLSSSC